jgi:SOS-response transcriptional repressor LexA
MNNSDFSLTTITPNSIGEQIKRVRRDHKLTQKQFSASLGIAQGFLCAIERGRKKPSTTLLIAIQHLYNSSMDGVSCPEIARPRTIVLEPATGGQTGHKVPLLQSDSIPGTSTTLRSCDEYISLPGLPENCFAIRYSGDFMSPTIRDGDIVIIAPDIVPGPGKIVLITGQWEEPFLRRHRSKGGETYYTADNSVYSPFKPDTSTRVLGVVVSVWRRINF